MSSLFNNIHLLKLINQQRQIKSYRKEQLKELQNKRFKKILRYILEHSLFYQEFYQEQGISLKNIHDIKVSDLPIIDKKILMDNFDRVVCDRRINLDALKSFLYNPENYNKKFLNQYSIIHSSGSTGLAGVYLYNPHEWSLLKATIVSRVIDYEVNFKKKTKLFFIGALNGNYGGIKLSESVERRFSTFFPMSVTEPMEKIVAQLNEYQPDVIQGYASFVYLLALEKLDGRLNVQPRKIMCTVDPLTETMEQTIFNAFGIKPVNFYAAAESLILGAKPAGCQLMYLFDDMNIYELVDENSNPVADHEMGTLILTNLYNYSLPLIRYRMNDQLAITPERCSCGLPFTHIQSLSGRIEEYLWFTDETGQRTFIHPQVFITLHIHGLKQFQIIQTGTDKITMKAVIQGEPNPVMDEIKTYIHRILSVKGMERTVKFEIEAATEIKNDPKTGKFRLIIPQSAEGR